MGCKGSSHAKAAEEAPSGGDKDTSSDYVPRPPPGDVPEDGKRRGSLTMDSTVVGKILDMMGASNEQIAFFSVWDTHVHKKAVAVAKEQQLFISTDLRFLEVRVTASSASMQGYLRSFVDKVGDLPKNSIDELDMVLDTLQGDMEGPQLLTVWCKFKHCRSDAPPPSVDCGYILNQDLQWAVIDVMMPSHDDEDALRDYAVGEKHAPVLYGSSILPVAPEKQLGFALKETASQNSRQILLTAFFFYKALGLMKPEDRIVRILNTCQCESLVVCAGLGPQGLVRLALSLIHPKSTKVAKELAEELASQYREKDLMEIQELMRGEADIVDYVGETRGYGIRLGFIQN